MKTDFFARVSLLLCSALVVRAAPLPATTAVHTKPDASAPTITVLKAGTEAPAPASNEAAPAGWQAIELPGPFEGWVENKDLTKNLDVKPGALIRFTPKADAGVLAVADKADKTSIAGLRGKWTQITLEKKLIGYIKLDAPAAAAPVAPPAPSTPAPVAPSPVAPGVYGVSAPGQAAPMVNLGDGGSSSLPRQFAGRFVSTRRPFTPRRPYDYALNDDAGKRYAYLDISKLLLTEQIEKYVDHHVYVFGTAKASADGKDIVIAVETLQLK
jgi:hypothetical protein